MVSTCQNDISNVYEIFPRTSSCQYTNGGVLDKMDLNKIRSNLRQYSIYLRNTNLNILLSLFCYFCYTWFGFTINTARLYTNIHYSYRQ